MYKALTSNPKTDKKNHNKTPLYNKHINVINNLKSPKCRESSELRGLYDCIGYRPTKLPLTLRHEPGEMEGCK
jgi:hypothetical protein